MSNTGAKSDSAPPGDVDGDRDVVESDAKEVGDEQKVPEETLDAEGKSLQAVSVSEQGAGGETVDSEMGSKKGEDNEKTEENAAADSASAAKESSVEGDDQNKRFVTFCLLENPKWLSLLHWFRSSTNLDALLEVKKKNALCICPFVIPYTRSSCLLPINE